MTPPPALPRRALLLGLALAAAVLASTAVDAALTAAAQVPAPPPVLGLSGLMGPHGEGWGAVAPAVIYNGGVYSGRIERVSWRRWGGRVAIGRGRKAVYKPGGGYHARKVPVRIRASRVRACPAAPGQAAYIRMTVSHRVRPGGPWTAWAPWTLDLCDADARPRSCAPVAFGRRRDHGASDITAWDVRCRVARRVARASRRVPARRGRSGAGMAQYTRSWRGFACAGYSLSRMASRPTIAWTCHRRTAQVTFKQW